VHDHSKFVIIRHIPPTNQRLPLFIVGDVHGCAEELDLLLQQAALRVPRFQLVLVGDLFTKGPDPIGVYKIIKKYRALCIKGNHDWALLSILSKTKLQQTSPPHIKQTLKLIEPYRSHIFRLLAALPHALKTEIQLKVSRRGWEPNFTMWVVHAGIDASRGVEKTSEKIILTARYVRWVKHHQTNQWRLITTGSPSGVASPPKKSEKPEQTRRTDAFRWHELHNGPELVLFGHDAVQCLFRKTAKNGRPIAIGLDTGCTYGKAITGYFPEYDDAVQVYSKSTYFDSKTKSILGV
jgi:hypothetical protein